MFIICKKELKHRVERFIWTPCKSKEFKGTHKVECKITFFSSPDHQKNMSPYRTLVCNMWKYDPLKVHLPIIFNQQPNKINIIDLTQHNATACGFATNIKKAVLIFQKDYKKRKIQNCFEKAEWDSECVLEKWRHAHHGDTRVQVDAITKSPLWTEHIDHKNRTLNIKHGFHSHSD